MRMEQTHCFTPFGDVRYRWSTVTVHGLNPYPPYDLIHLELQVPGAPLRSQAENQRIWDALRQLLGPQKFERIWTLTIVGEQPDDKKGLEIATLVNLLDEDYF